MIKIKHLTTHFNYYLERDLVYLYDTIIIFVNLRSAISFAYKLCEWRGSWEVLLRPGTINRLNARN